MLSFVRGNIRRLNHVFRYSNVPTVGDKESVASHAWYVAFYSYCMVEELKAHGVDVDGYEVLSQALAHDNEEVLTGDLLHPVRHGSPEMAEASHALARLAQEQISQSIPGHAQQSFLSHATHAKDRTVEGRIVALADYLSVWSFATSQIDQGNVRNYAPVEANATQLIDNVLDDLGSLHPEACDIVCQLLFGDGGARSYVGDPEGELTMLASYDNSANSTLD